MLRQSQRSVCYILMFILLMAGMYTTYVKADEIAERAVAMEAAQLYEKTESAVRVIQLQKTDEVLTRSVCVVENVNPLLRTMLGRITGRSISSRRDLQFYGTLLLALCVAYFVLRCQYEEEILCLHEKKYRAALIKYIHDTDGKKRVACLT